MLIKKTDKAIQLFLEGEEKKAMKIFKTFRIGLTREEKRIIEIGTECLCGKADFYRMLGIDPEGMIAKAKEVVEEKWVNRQVEKQDA